MIQTIESILESALVGKTILKIDNDISFTGKITKTSIVLGWGGIAGLEISIQGKGKRILPFDQEDVIEIKE